jgi:hypothetical protein
MWHGQWRIMGQNLLGQILLTLITFKDQPKTLLDTSYMQQDC